MMRRRHVIISGTGRAGTTFLVQLCTALGLDTGYQSLPANLFDNCNAGMEHDLRDPAAPYIIKNPWLCDSLDDVVREGQVEIVRAIVPIRDLFAAAESRRDVERRSVSRFAPGQVPGGLWHVSSPEDQENVLARQLYKLLHVVARYDIPLTLLDFPRIAIDPDYLYEKLAFLWEGIERDRFWVAFDAVAAPELIHDFRSGEPSRHVG